MTISLVFITKVLHTALLFSALILLWRSAPIIVKAINHYKRTLQELVAPQGSLGLDEPSPPGHISISIPIFASILSLIILSVGFGFWGRVVQSALPTLDITTIGHLNYAWQITRVLGLITLFMLCWQLHAVCRGVMTTHCKAWRMEQEMIAIVLGTGVLLTALGL